MEGELESPNMEYMFKCEARPPISLNAQKIIMPDRTDPEKL